MMELDTLLDALFPAGHRVSVHGDLVAGEAQTAQGTVAVLGTTHAAAIGHEIALGLAGRVIEVMRQHPRRPIVFLVDTQGQALSRAEELLCLNGSFAHLASCVDAARRSGHPTLGLVTGVAVSGGFLSFGLMSDRVYALAASEVRVMDLRAMARVTKLEHERLVELAKTVPTFAPGAENYVRMGAIDAVWPQPSAALLEAALGELIAAPSVHDGRMQRGRERGGRLAARATFERVLAA